MLTVAARDDIFGPVMVNRTCGQIRELHTRSCDLRFALRYGYRIIASVAAT